MNKKTEDQLVRLAFGDLSPEEAARWQKEAAADPESVRTLETYRQMKEELRNLGDVPADQLSKERLREAILTRGLKPRPVRRQIGWLWMPAAAAAIAFGVVFIKGQMNTPSSTGTTVVMNDESTVPWPEMPEFKISRTPIVSTGPITHTDDLVPDTQSHARDRRKTNHDADRMVNVNRDDDNRLAYLGNKISNGSAEGVPSAPSPITTAAPTTASLKDEASEARMDSAMGYGALSAPGGGNGGALGAVPPAAFLLPTGNAAGAKPSIVVIQSETDHETGAQKATEVGSTNNVLVGG